MFFSSNDKLTISRNAVVRSHKSDTVLHRINHDEERILGSSLRKSILLPDRMVQSKERRIHPDGGGYASYVSKFHVLDVISLRNCMLYTSINRGLIKKKKKKKNARVCVCVCKTFITSREILMRIDVKN